MPRGGGMRSGKAQRFVLGPTKSQTVETARAQSRKGRIAGLVPRSSQRLRAKRTPFEAQADEKVSEPPGGREWPSGQTRPPTEPAPARAPGDRRSRPSTLARVCRNRHRKRRASSTPRGPRAGESGVDRKVGPI